MLATVIRFAISSRAVCSILLSDGGCHPQQQGMDVTGRSLFVEKPESSMVLPEGVRGRISLTCYAIVVTCDDVT